MRVACGFDHAGFVLKKDVFDAVTSAGCVPADEGTDSPVPGDDYPDIALAVCSAIARGGADRGILVCGSGAGAAVAACKVPGIRAVSVQDHYTAHQCVEHDDVNVLCLGGRVIGSQIARDLIAAFLAARFVGREPGQERHLRRTEKVAAIERDGLNADLQKL